MACAARIDDRIEARTEGGMPGEVRPWTLVDTNCDEGSRWLALAKALWPRPPRIRFMVVRGDGHSARGHVLRAQLGLSSWVSRRVETDSGPCMMAAYTAAPTLVYSA